MFKNVKQLSKKHKRQYKNCYELSKIFPNCQKIVKMSQQIIEKLKQMAITSQYGVQKCKRTAKKQNTVEKLSKIFFVSRSHILFPNLNFSPIK